MATRIKDRWLWLGLGIFTLIAVKGVAYGLHEFVQLTEVRNNPPKERTTPRKKPRKEDAIKTESLAILATCSNIDIRKAATKILCDRFLASERAKDLVHLDHTSEDPETVRRAIAADNLIYEFAPGQVSYLSQFRNKMAALRARRENPLETPQARHNGQGVEEQELRRRRREAVVVNEGDRPVSQEDIIQMGGGGGLSEGGVRDAEQALADVVWQENVWVTMDDLRNGVPALPDTTW